MEKEKLESGDVEPALTDFDSSCTEGPPYAPCFSLVSNEVADRVFVPSWVAIHEEIEEHPWKNK